MVATRHETKFDFVKKGDKEFIESLKKMASAITISDKRIKELSKQVNKSQKDIERYKTKNKELTKTINTLNHAIEKETKTKKKSHGATTALTEGMTHWIKNGMIMAVGWQLITQVQQVAMQTIKDLFWKYSELEAAMISIRAVTEATGRSYVEIMGLMSEHTDAFMSKTALAPGVMRLLSTSLSTKQIGQFIQAVKDGSAAMGYQADEQLPILARGFKQLTANILDNIGVTIYLDDIKKKAAKTHNISIDALTEEQIHLELLNETTRQTAKYQGLYNKQMETAKGSVAGLKVSYVELMEQISEGNIPIVRNIIDITKKSIEWLTKWATTIDDIKNKHLTLEQSQKGVGTVLDVGIEAMYEYIKATGDVNTQVGFLADTLDGLEKVTSYSRLELKSLVDVLLEKELRLKEGVTAIADYAKKTGELDTYTSQLSDNIDILGMGIGKSASEFIDFSYAGDMTSSMIAKLSEKTGVAQSKIKELVNEEYKGAAQLKETGNSMITVADITEGLTDTLDKNKEKVNAESEAVKGLQEAVDDSQASINRITELVGDSTGSMGLFTIKINEQKRKLADLNATYNDFSYILGYTTEEFKNAKAKGGAEYIKFIEDNIKGVEGLKHKFDELADSIKDTNREMTDSKSKLGVLQKEYDSLNKVLYPDNVLNRVDRYKEVLKEVETANKNIIKSQEELREAELAVSESRVEPEIMARMIKDEETARINLYKAEVEADKKKKEELGLRGQLKGRLKEVADAMSIEQSNYDTLSSKLEIYESQQKSISIQMRINKEDRQLLNGQLGIYNGLLKDEEDNKDDLLEQAEEYAKKIKQEKDLLSADDGLRDATKLVVDETENLFDSRQKIIEQSTSYFSSLMKATLPFMTPLLDAGSLGATAYKYTTGGSVTERLHRTVSDYFPNNSIDNNSIPNNPTTNDSIPSNTTTITGDVHVHAPNNSTFTSIINDDVIQNNITAETGGT